MNQAMKSALIKQCEMDFSKLHIYLFSIVFIEVFLIGVLAGQSIVKSPTNTTGTIGGTAHFVCVVDYNDYIPTTTWKFNDRIIYFNRAGDVRYPDGTNKYVVSVTDTIFTLEVRTLIYTDGGHYTCDAIGRKASATLIVLGLPVITQDTTNLMEGTTTTFTCESRFGGPSTDKISPDQHPQMKLFLDDVTYQAESNSNLQDKFLIKKMYTILVDGSMDNKDLKCAFGTPNSINLTSSTTLNVQYSVRGITYSPKEDKYELGSVIICSARGNPNPLFEWRNKANPGMVIKGPLLHITEAMEGKNSWTCTARNSVDGRMYEGEISANIEAVSKYLQEETAYSVRSIIYSPNEVQYTFGSNITCSASGNPNPLFEWRNKANPDVVIKGPLLPITDDMEGKNSWTCTARNAVAGQMYEDEITAHFVAASNNDVKHQAEKAPVWLVFGLIASGCVTTISLCCLVCLKFKAKHHPENKFAKWLGVAGTKHHHDKEKHDDLVQNPRLLT